MLDGLMPAAVQSIGAVADALEAECWASELVSIWDRMPLAGDAGEVVPSAAVCALERMSSPHALAALRALSAVGGGRHATLAAAAANRLAARGVPEPAWADQVGRAEPVAAELMYEEAFDDGVSVFIEFAPPAGEPHTIGIYIDHNMGGLVKDAFLTGPLSEVRSHLSARAHNGVGLRLRTLDLAEARARAEEALFILDHTYAPPVDEDVRALRALIDARLRLLPEGVEPADDDDDEISFEARDELLADFLDSSEGRRWRGDADAQDVVRVAIEFGAGYNHGGPLRWSPVVVEIFMMSWLARKVAREPAFFALVPDVLPDWVRYAGHIRGVPAQPLREAARAVATYRREMLDAVDDATLWGPAKTFALAARADGVDLTDADALQAFVARYNEGLAA